MKSKTLIRMISKLGYSLVRRNKHDIYSNGTITVILPQHKTVDKHIAKDTLKLIGYPENVNELNYFVKAA